MIPHEDDTIIAPATALGGAIAVIRLSGKDAFKLIDTFFLKHQKPFCTANHPSHTLHFGEFIENDTLIDQVLVSLFKAPHSYTGQDTVEISCHGSEYIVQKIIQCGISSGARLAKPGEFTFNAFMNGKLNLTQAEAVADLIVAQSQAEHHLAINQMRGGFSDEIQILRKNLVNFASLLELELDFSQEDIEFVDRSHLTDLLKTITHHLEQLLLSFEYGNSLKKGIPVAIVGKPNAGKSSLLNGLFNEEKAIVSNIAGTTRDSIEDILIIDGLKYRFIDTAGLRKTSDEIEAIGVQRTKEKVKQAKILVYLFDLSTTSAEEVITQINELKHSQLIIILAQTHLDLYKNRYTEAYRQIVDVLHHDSFAQLYLSLQGTDVLDSIQTLKDTLRQAVQTFKPTTDTIISNTRHLEAIQLALHALEQVKIGIQHHLSTDLLSSHLKEALQHIGSIAGVIDIDHDIFQTIFGEFCIGK